GAVTIGGCVDARVVEAAERVLATDAPELVVVDFSDDDAAELGLTCGGSVRVWVEPVRPADAGDPAVAAYRAAEALVAQGADVWIGTALDATRERLVARADDAPARARLDAGRERFSFVERHAPPETMVIVGAGDVATVLARFARELRMRTVVVDGRARYATPERFPGVDELLVGMPSELVMRIVPTPHTYLVLLSHDYKYELPVLRYALRAPIGYVGMLGSRRRGDAVRGMLREEGFTDAELARLRSPVGLDIGGQDAAEIALSIAAELVALREGRWRGRGGGAG
ncbi:MAG TPA: XdhC family protein, partial [Gemmatimonadaceae bacterium]|nr:XdhC family protein [Gemmatimonadaceae bacterium]